MVLWQRHTSHISTFFYHKCNLPQRNVFMYIVADFPLLMNHAFESLDTLKIWHKNTEHQKSTFFPQKTVSLLRSLTTMWCLLMEDNWSHFFFQRNDNSISRNNYEFHIFVGGWQSKFIIANGVWILSQSQYLMKLVSPWSPNLKALDFSQRVFEREYVQKKPMYIRRTEIKCCAMCCKLHWRSSIRLHHTRVNTYSCTGWLFLTLDDTVFVFWF